MATSPASPYVADIATLAEAKNYLKQTYSGITAEDTLIGEQLQAARRWIEQFTNQSIIKKTIVAQTEDELDVFYLPFAPIQTVTSVYKILLDGTATLLTLNTDYYVVGLTEKKIVLYKTWSTSAYQVVGIKVTYDAYMDAVPKTLKDCALALMAEFYVNRGSDVKIPQGIIERLAPFKRVIL